MLTSVTQSALEEARTLDTVVIVSTPSIERKLSAWTTALCTVVHVSIVK